MADGSSWTCRFLERPALRVQTNEYDAYLAGTVDYDKLEVGDMCYAHKEGAPLAGEELKRWHLSEHYFANNAHRPPLMAKLPGPTYFLIDGQCYSGRCETCSQLAHACKCAAPKVKGYYGGWTVSGAPPLITVQPSINIEHSYHGFLTSGVIGGDVEGRVYDASGVRDRSRGKQE